MALQSRRQLLRAGGGILAASLGGCTIRHTGENGTGGTEPAGTLAPGQTYTIQLVNKISKSDLRPVSEIAADAPATVTVRAEANYESDDETLFEETADLQPSTSRTYADAFSTDPDGPEYVVAAKLTPFRETDQWKGYSHTSAHRFVPGEFQAPTDDTFRVVVRDGEPGLDFGPWIQVE
jgi:hypothetical protein